MPFSQGLVYVAADALFPNSRFILSQRPADKWFTSMCDFHKRAYKLEDLTKLTEKDIMEKFLYLYPGYTHSSKERLLSSFKGDTKRVMWEKLYDYEYYTSMYSQRNEEIKRYFMDAPHKLLSIDITREKTTERICEFLNIPPELAIHMPSNNASTSVVSNL